MAMSSGFRWLIRASNVAFTEFMGFLERGMRADRSEIPAARHISNILDETRRPKPRDPLAHISFIMVVSFHRSTYLVVS